MRSVESFLADLHAVGIEIIYSSALVPPDLQAPVVAGNRDPLAAARAALAANGLELWEVAPGRYVVRRESVAVTTVKPAPVADEGPLQEISVYASRFSIDGRSLNELLTLGGPEIDLVPGAHDDAMRALKSLPGVAGNLSARPYIRGSLSEDVLVRFDGITLLDPYHLKKFQSLFSAIDPAAVERIEVFSGGFPVQYGTRSGGVINVTPPSVSAGYENRIAVSAISAGASSIGHASDLPIEWFAAVRRSTLDLLEPVEDGFGKPQFSDSLGRMRWTTGNGAWTAGWLLLDDQLELGSPEDEEFADARYRDEYVWVAREHRFGGGLETHVSAILTTAERERRGTVNVPGVETGTLDEAQEFDRFEISNFWSYSPHPRSTFVFGGELSISHSAYEYSREVQFTPQTAAAFGRPEVDILQTAIKPEVVTYALYAANRRRWADFEAEIGLRVDGQDLRDMGHHTQVSPRLNLRYDVNRRARIYASAGRFTQAQHIEEWRVEEGQSRADPAQLSIHTVLGFSFDTQSAARWSVEAYSKRWTRVSPYFDNTLNPLSLLPDLAPDRVRLAPRSSEASGLEVNGRVPVSDRSTAWGSLSWSRVADDFGTRDVLRSWDQSLAFSLGYSWQWSSLSLSALGGWHRGWPRTRYELTAPTDPDPGSIELGVRNAVRWQDFYSLDLRASWTWRLERGDFATTLELTNATNRSNPCCAFLEGANPGPFVTVETDNWLPAIVNLGFVFRWRDD